MSIVPLTGTANLSSNHTEFLELVELAESCCVQGKFAAAAGYAQAAAQHAWLNPNGLFTSDRLERLLGELALVVPSQPAAPRWEGSRRTAEPAKVLHVITQAYQTGGSTQFVACWIDDEPERQHSICLTQQGVTEVPEKVRSRTGRPGSLVRLDSGRGSLLDRALVLRRLAVQADVILLNVHPHDVVPSIALLGQPGLPPIVYVNHADHVFWIGTRVAETVLNMRLSGSELAANRRGIERNRLNLTCRPLRPVGRTVSRDDAKRSFGLEPTDILVVTAADGSKYRSIGQQSLVEMILPAFESNSRLRLLAAGPAAEGEWADAARRTDGRITALGPLPDVYTLHQAADIYLDSYPFSSLTSLLEAGSFGTPSITYRGHPDSCAVLGADTHGLDNYMVRPTDPDELRADLARLAEDDTVRDRLGTAIQQAIVDTHTGSGWRAGVERLYAEAALSTPVPDPVPVDRRCDTLDQLLISVMDQTGFSRGIDGALTEQLSLLPLRERMAVARRLRAAGHQPGPRKLLPTWMLLPLLRARRRLRAARRS